MGRLGVRRERVILELEDHLSTGMAKAAAATALTARALDGLDGSAVDVEKSLPRVSRETDALGQASRRSTSDINQLTGRMALLARVGATIGPAFAPIAAVGVAGIAGLASQLGFASVGALSLIAATQGVGDALKAVNDAALEPTAKNLEKAEQAMAKLAPQAQEFVARFQELRPVLGDLRDAAARGWFPGLTQALDSLEDAAPRLERILFAVSSAGGDAIASGADSLAGERWADFFQFVEDEAPDAIAALSRSVGSLAHGFAELWMAFDPVNDGVRDWLVDVADSFDDWATGLDQTEGFAEFLAYVNENGPRVADAAKAIANAVLQIGEAAAPLGGPVLEALTAIANAIAAIADSPIGTPLLGVITAMSSLSLASRVLDSGLATLEGRFGRVGVAATRAQGSMARLGGKAGGVLAVAASVTLLGNALADMAGAKLDMSDLSRDLEAIAQGRSTEALARIAEDLAIVGERIPVAGRLSEGINEAVTGFGLFGNTGLDNAEDNLKAFDEALAQLVESGNADKAAQILENIAASQLGLLPGSSISPAYMDDLAGSFGSYSKALENTAGSTDIAAESTEKFSLKQEKARAAMAASRDAARESAKAFVDFSDAIAGDDFSLSKYLKAFEDQVRALGAFRDNIQTLRDRGLRPAVVDNLIEQGPAAAQAVEGLAKGGQESIRRLNRAFVTSRQEIRGMGEDASTAKGKLEGLGDAETKPTARLDLNPFDSAIASLEGALSSTNRRETKPKADLDKKPFDTAMDKLNGALGAADRRGAKPFVILQGVPEAERALANLARPRNVAINPFVGGFGAANGTTVPKTGLPYADRHPYMLADGEEVVSDRRGQATAYRPVLKAINAGMPPMVVKGMLADGGTARAIKVSSPSAPAASYATSGVAFDPSIGPRLESIEEAIRLGTAVNAGEHDADRRSMRSGAGAIARSRPRSRLP